MSSSVAAAAAVRGCVEAAAEQFAAEHARWAALQTQSLARAACAEAEVLEAALSLRRAAYVPLSTCRVGDAPGSKRPLKSLSVCTARGWSTLPPVGVPAASALPRSVTWTSTAENLVAEAASRRLLLYEDKEGEMMRGSDSEDEPQVRATLLLCRSRALIDSRSQERALDQVWSREEDFVLLSVLSAFGACDESLCEVAAFLRFDPVAVSARMHGLRAFPVDAASWAVALTLPAPAPPVLRFDTANVELAVDSHRVLYCRRCHRFDCQLHGVSPLWLDSRPAASPLPEPCEPKEGCSPSCYKLVPAGSSAPWSSMEQSMLETGQRMFGSDACKLARLLGSRSCTEVASALAHATAGEEAEAAACGMPAARRPSKRRLRGSSVRQKSTETVRRRMAQGASEIWSQFTPCSCEGACTGDSCSCTASGNFCEAKLCGCPTSCPNRFMGCSCLRSMCRTRACPCFAAARECDPDLCRRCTPAVLCAWQLGGGSVPPLVDDCCENMRLRLRQHKRIAMGRSAVSGWGAFLVDGAKRNELLDEVRHPLCSRVHLPGLQYTGELITQAEADRRGRVYDISDASFLFMLSAPLPPETLVASPR